MQRTDQQREDQYLQRAGDRLGDADFRQAIGIAEAGIINRLDESGRRQRQPDKRRQIDDGIPAQEIKRRQYGNRADRHDDEESRRRIFGFTEQIPAGMGKSGDADQENGDETHSIFSFNRFPFALSQ